MFDTKNTTQYPNFRANADHGSLVKDIENSCDSDSDDALVDIVTLYRKYEHQVPVHELVKITHKSSDLKKKKISRCLISEDSLKKQIWDALVMCLIFFIAIALPYRLAFESEDTQFWIVMGYCIDGLFFVDLVLTFLHCYYDEALNVHVNTHKAIAISYLKGWFIIDLISIVPIEPILAIFLRAKSIQMNSLVKVGRISKLYKLMRFMRLTKLVRLIKKTKRAKDTDTILKINAGLERMSYFCVLMFFYLHIISCFWILLK